MFRDRPQPNLIERSQGNRNRFTALMVAFVVAVLGFVPCYSTHGQYLLDQPDEVTNVGIDEHLNTVLPLDEEYVDEVGRKLPLRTYFQGNKPVLLTFNYSGCPKLCDAQLSGLVRTLQQMELQPGRDFEYISMSINPEERSTRARESRDTYVERYGDLDTKDGWHFLTGDEDSIALITQTCGFRYEYLPSRNEFAHAPVFILCTPDGRIARYLYGVEVEPKLMRLSLIEAGNGAIGGSMDQVILWCFNYDPDSNSYIPQALNLMKLGGIATVIVIAAICVPFWFSRPRRRGADARPSSDDAAHTLSPPSGEQHTD